MTIVKIPSFLSNPFVNQGGIIGKEGIWESKIFLP
jgi:hypothetical protein